MINFQRINFNLRWLTIHSSTCNKVNQANSIQLILCAWLILNVDNLIPKLLRRFNSSDWMSYFFLLYVFSNIISCWHKAFPGCAVLFLYAVSYNFAAVTLQLHWWPNDTIRILWMKNKYARFAICRHMCSAYYLN